MRCCGWGFIAPATSSEASPPGVVRACRVATEHPSPVSSLSRHRPHLQYRATPDAPGGRQMRTMVPPRPTSRERTLMSATNDLLENAHAYGVAFDKGELPMPPGLHMAIVACTDARLNPYELLGLAEGD